MAQFMKCSFKNTVCGTPTTCIFSIDNYIRLNTSQCLGFKMSSFISFFMSITDFNFP